MSKSLVEVWVVFCPPKLLDSGWFLAPQRDANMGVEDYKASATEAARATEAAGMNH